MSHILALIVASTGLALNTAGPDCTASKDCPLASAKADACCTDGACDHCKEMKAAAYNDAAWPAHNTELYAKDLQGQTLPVALGSETWISNSVDTTGKVVVLDFWATWCPPCLAASPILDELQKENPDTLAVLAIAGQNNPESDVRDYVNKHEVAYAHLYDADQSVFKPFNSEGIPLVVVLSTDGVIRWIGNPHEDDFVAAVETTIKADPAVQAQLTAQASATKVGS